MHIYKTYDQKALNDQYNNRARVADFSALVRQWDYRSKRLRQDVRAFLNIAYGSGRREELDIFPSGKDSAIQVFFHGGYWMAMDKQLFHFIQVALREDPCGNPECAYCAENHNPEGQLDLSPEQLRSMGVRKILKQREIGCWVFDEAHCLSKWGNDFRPDYLYAARFIREFSKEQGQAVPLIGCFTATA